MSLNTSKCAKMTITRKKQVHNYTYKINGAAISHVNEYKYLGVVFSSNLSWSSHIGHLVSKASKRLWLLRNRLKHCTTKTKLTAYTALVRPLLEYADVLWDPHTQVDINHIEGVQKKALRFIYNAYGRHVSVTNLLRQSELQTLQSRRKLHRLKLLHGIINNLTNINFGSYMEYNTSRPTRGKHSSTIVVPRCRTKAYQFSFFPKTISEWNGLPRDVVSLTNQDSFLSAVVSLL